MQRAVQEKSNFPQAFNLFWTLDSECPSLLHCTNGYCYLLLQRAKERQTLLAQNSIASVTKKSKASKGLGNRDTTAEELGQSRKYQSILLL